MYPGYQWYTQSDIITWELKLQLVPGGPRNWELPWTASFSFPSHLFHNYCLHSLPPSLAYLTHPPLYLTPSSRDFMRKCNWRNKPSFSLLLICFTLFTFGQHIMQNFPSVTSLASLPYLTLWHRNSNKVLNIASVTLSACKISLSYYVSDKFYWVLTLFFKITYPGYQGSPITCRYYFLILN